MEKTEKISINGNSFPFCKSINIMKNKLIFLEYREKMVKSDKTHQCTLKIMNI